MQFITPPVGSGVPLNLNIYETPANLALEVGASAAMQRAGHGPGLHKILSESMGAATVGLISSIDLTKGKLMAALIGRHIAILTNSPTGSVADILPVKSPINGPANIKEGIAVLSGQKSRD